MQDLNDLFYFAKVVEKGGFTAAALALGIPKSRLSRRITDLENRLGVRLLQRSTRHLSVTEIGQQYYRQCAALVEQATMAQETIDSMRAEPRGLIRVTATLGATEIMLAPALPRFLAAHPHVNVHLEVTNRKVDVIEEGIDIAIRVVVPPIEDSQLVSRRLGTHARMLVATPQFLERHGRPVIPEDLAERPTIDRQIHPSGHVWRLEGPRGEVRDVAVKPRLMVDEPVAVKQAVLAGIGIAQVTESVCASELAAGQLEQVLPAWSLPLTETHAVYASRRGMVPAVSDFLEFLSEEYARRSQSEGGVPAAALGAPERSPFRAEMTRESVRSIPAATGRTQAA